MINKYAEISERVLLYNAMKGILRVKMAEDSTSADPTMFQRFLNRAGIGMALAGGSNGVALKPVEDGNDEVKMLDHADHSLKSRGRQLAAIGTIGAGTIGGGAAGYYGGRAAANALGLDSNSEGLKRFGRYALMGGGTLAGGTLGYLGSAALAGMYNGKLDPAKQKKAIEARINFGKAMDSSGDSKLDNAARMARLNNYYQSMADQINTI